MYKEPYHMNRQTKELPRKLPVMRAEEEVHLWLNAESKRRTSGKKTTNQKPADIAFECFMLGYNILRGRDVPNQANQP